MKKEIYSSDKSLIVPEKENIFKRFFKWISNIFNKDSNDENSKWNEQNVDSKPLDITIPKAVQIPLKITEQDAVDENSLEYLYNLSDEELDELDNLYDAQMEEAKTEIEKLDSMLQTYRESIKKLQSQLTNTSDSEV